jgi:hypothetical protein
MSPKRSSWVIVSGGQSRWRPEVRKPTTPTSSSCRRTGTSSSDRKSVAANRAVSSLSMASMATSPIGIAIPRRSTCAPAPNARSTVQPTSGGAVRIAGRAHSHTSTTRSWSMSVANAESTSACRASISSDALTAGPSPSAVTYAKWLPSSLVKR